MTSTHRPMAVPAHNAGMADPPGPTPLRRVGRVLAVVLVFVLLGPPVGALAFMLTAALIGLGRSADLAGLTWIALFALIYAVPLSYLIGAVPAAVAGLIVGIRQVYFGPATWPYAVGAGLVVGCGVLIVSGQRITADSDVSLPVIMMTCLVPTLVCWLFVRGWYSAHTLAGRAA